MMKKIISLVLVVCMIMSMTAVSFAQNSLQNGKLNFVSDINKVSKAFGITVKDRSVSQSNDYTVDYDYKVEDLENSDEVKVSLNGSISNGEEIYVFNTSGEIDSVDLSDGKKFIEGPLDGKIIINDIKHDITVGFRTIRGSNEISAGLTIYPNKNNENFKDILFISFGDYVKTQELINKLNKTKMIEKPAVNDEITKEVRGSFSYAGSDYADLKTDGLSSQTGNGQKIKVYTDDSAKRIRVDLYTYSYKFDDSDFQSVPDGDFIDAGIHEFRIGLRRTNGDGYIDGLEELNLDHYIGKKTVLEDMFLDMLGAADIPSWTVAAMFENARGKITGSDSTNNTYVNVVVEVGKIIDFDSDEMKVIFQTTNNNDDKTTFKAYSEVTYVIDCLQAAFYVHTDDTSAKVYMEY